jgi:hypothetical protein
MLLGVRFCVGWAVKGSQQAVRDLFHVTTARFGL